MGGLCQAVEIIFGVQRIRSNGKITRRKISFPTYKIHFFFPFFSLFGPLLFSNLITFLFLIHLKILKCYRSANLWTLIATKQHTKIFFGVRELTFVVFDGLFFEFLTPFTLGGHNFLISNPFSTIVNVSKEEGFKFFLDIIMEPSLWIWPTLSAQVFDTNRFILMCFF